MKKRLIQIILGIIIFAFVIFGIECLMKNDTAKLDAEYEELKKDSITYDENVDIEELKQEYKITGATELYEIQTEYDGRKVLAIKAEENYKVAFAGLIKRNKPEKNEVSEIFEKDYPTENGIWIEAESREKILKYLNENLSSKYVINENGYLKIEDRQNSEKDDQIELLINGDKQYLLSVNSVSYYIDALTGEIVDDIYEELDKYQIYSYFKDGNKMIIYITENKEKALTSDEIFENILELMK